MTKTPITDRLEYKGMVCADDMRSLETAAQGLRDAAIEYKRRVVLSCIARAESRDLNDGGERYAAACLAEADALDALNSEIRRFDALKEGK